MRFSITVFLRFDEWHASTGTGAMIAAGDKMMREEFPGA